MKFSVEEWEENAARSIAAEQHQRLQCEKAKLRKQCLADAQALRRELRTVDAKDSLHQMSHEKRLRICSSVSDKSRRSATIMSDKKNERKKTQEKIFQKRISNEEADRQQERQIHKSKSKLLALSLGQTEPKKTSQAISKTAYGSLTQGPVSKQTLSLNEMARLQIAKMDIMVPQRSKWK